MGLALSISGIDALGEGEDGEPGLLCLLSVYVYYLFISCNIALLYFM